MRKSRWAPAEERFWAKVVQNDEGCWEWQGYIAQNGYGRFQWEGRESYPHRFAHERFVGQIPEGFDIDHLCRNRRCVNPTHLEAVPRIVNAQRGEHPNVVQGRLGHCRRGHPYNEKNTYIYRNMRQCRRCKQERRRLARLEGRRAS